MNKSIVLDCDGVLADFEGAFCEEFGYNSRHLTPLEERYPEYKDDIELFVMSSATYENLDVLPTGVKIARWAESEGFDIYVVSSRPSYTAQVTGLWLKRNRIPFHFLEVGIYSKISEIIRIDPVLAVDDMLEVCWNCYRFQVYSMLMDSPWNQDKIPAVLSKRIRKFEDFEQEIGKIRGIYGI